MGNWYLLLTAVVTDTEPYILIIHKQKDSLS